MAKKVTVTVNTIQHPKPEAAKNLVSEIVLKELQKGGSINGNEMGCREA